MKLWEKCVHRLVTALFRLYGLQKVCLVDGKVATVKYKAQSLIFLVIVLYMLVERVIWSSNFEENNLILKVALDISIISSGLGTIYCFYIESFSANQDKKYLFQNLNTVRKSLYVGETSEIALLKNINWGLLYYLMCLALHLSQLWCESEQFVIWELCKLLMDMAVVDMVIQVYLCAVAFHVVVHILRTNYVKSHHIEDMRENSLYEKTTYGYIEALEVRSAIDVDALIEACEKLKECVWKISSRYGILMLFQANSTLMAFVMGASYMSGGSDLLQLSSNPFMAVSYIIRKGRSLLTTVTVVLMTETLKYHTQMLVKMLCKMLVYTKHNDHPKILRFLTLLTRNPATVQQYGVEIDLTLILSMVAITTSYAIVMIQSNG